MHYSFSDGITKALVNAVNNRKKGTHVTASKLWLIISCGALL